MLNVKKGVIACFCAQEKDIIWVENCDFVTFGRTLSKIMDKVYDNYGEGKKTLIFLYYAGHAEMDNTVYATLNADTKATYRFPLEQQLRTLSKIPGAYVIGLFDSCRTSVHPALRGGPGEPDAGGNYQNCYLSFGSEPNLGVPLASTTAKEWFAKLRELCG